LFQCAVQAAKRRKVLQIFEKKTAQLCFESGAKISKSQGFLQDARQKPTRRRKFSLKNKKSFCQKTISLYI
jgi:hypothetical protein